MNRKAGNAGNSPNREELYNMAVNAAKQGQRQGAKVMFGQIVEQDKENYRAMMWLAQLSTTEKERRLWLNRVLDLKPNFAPAQEALDKLNQGNTAKRNKQWLRFGTIGYMVVLIAVCAIYILSVASAGV
jgi:Tfp pilus assembly protein PilF